MSRRLSAAALTLMLLAGCAGSTADEPLAEGEGESATLAAESWTECLADLRSAAVEEVDPDETYRDLVGGTLAVTSLTIRTVTDVAGASLVETSRLDSSTGRIAVEAALQADPDATVEPEIELRRDNQAVYLTGTGWRERDAFHGADWLGIDVRGQSEVASELVAFDPIAAAPLVGLEVLTTSPTSVASLGEPDACGESTQGWRVAVPSELAGGLLPNVALTVLGTSGVTEFPAGASVPVDVLTDSTGVVALRFDASPLLAAVAGGSADGTVPVTVATEFSNRNVATSVEIPAEADVEWVGDPVTEAAYRSGLITPEDAAAMTAYLSAEASFERSIDAFMSVYADPALDDATFFAQLPVLVGEVTAARGELGEAVDAVADESISASLDPAALPADGVVDALQLVIEAESVEAVDDAYKQFAFHESRYRAARDIVRDELRGLLGGELLGRLTPA